MRNGDVISAKVIEVGPTEIKYRKYGTDSATSAIYIAMKGDVTKISYQNGQSDVFVSVTMMNGTQDNPNPDTAQMYFAMGQTDSRVYYKAHIMGAGIGCAVGAIFFTPLGGLIPAAVCSSVEPDPDNFSIRDRQLLYNHDYMAGYGNAAFKIKKRRVWLDYCFGSVIFIGGFAALISGSRLF